MFIRLCMIVVFIAIIGTFKLSSTATANKTKKLNQSKTNKLWYKRLQLNKLKNKEGALLDKLAELDRKRLAVIALREKMKHNIKKLQQDIKKANQSAKLQQDICRLMQHKMRHRLRLFYRISRLGHARLLIGTKTLKELALRWSALRLLTTRDLKMLKNYQTVRHRVVNILSKLKQKERKMKQIIIRFKKNEQQLLQMRKYKKIALELIYKKASLFRRALQELHASQSNLKKMFKGWRSRSADRGLLSLQHLLPWPIKNFSPYCHRYETKWVGSFSALKCLDWRATQVPLRGKLGRTGITLTVSEGTPVIAIASGKIVYQGWVRGYGKLLLIDHGHRFHSLYAHLSRFGQKLGEMVWAEQVIALSGSTGILGKAGLYFEIRHNTRSLKPEEWLKLPSPN